MDNSVCMLFLTIIALVSGCTSETAKGTAYETLQNVHEQDCLKDPNSPSDCGKRDSYDDYEKQRKALEKVPN
ncbi:MAG TPA: hypothetical protein VMJ33_08655 [Gallionella sp.]|nr:hypothetical protein [Gallionella sp.]